MEYIERIQDYQPRHYKHYLEKCEKIIGKATDVNGWIRNLPMKDNLIWIKLVKNLNNNNKRFWEESAVLITLTITLFMLELEIENNEIELTNKDISNILVRFDKIVKLEYAYKKGIITRNGYIHTLLKDINK